MAQTVSKRQIGAGSIEAKQIDYLDPLAGRMMSNARGVNTPDWRSEK
jgi:hypothetical protein